MVLNGAEIRIRRYTVETIENDMIIYIEEDSTMLVINNTAGMILKVIIDAEAENRSITTRDIGNVLLKEYSLDKEQIDEICEDVDRTIKLFITSTILSYA